jgi:thiol:disulfide interchange protein DsbG
MTPYRLVFALLALLALLLGGCSRQDAPKAASPVKGDISIETVAAQAQGFAAGALMSTHTAYVFFDPQCPHCGHLWEASIPLHKKTRFVWIPVALINPTSASQGAALLASTNPVDLMTTHEASLLAGKGGISASSSVATSVEQAIKANTQLLTSLGADSVPFIVAKNQKSGQTVSKAGALTTAALAEFLGLDTAP